MQTLDDLLNEGVRGRRVLVRSDLNVPLDSLGSGAAAITDDGRIRASLPDHPRAARRRRPGGRDAPTSAGPRVRPTRSTRSRRSRSGWASCSAGRSARGRRRGRHRGRVRREKASQAAGQRHPAARERAVRGGRDQQGRRRARRASPTGSSRWQRRPGGRLGRLRRRRVRRRAPQARLRSTTSPQRLPHYAGHAGRWTRSRCSQRLADGPPEQPYVVVLGGSKVSDKLAVIQALLPKVDRLLIGGGMCFTFLKPPRTTRSGMSLLEAEMVETCAAAARRGRRQDRPADRRRRREGVLGRRAEPRSWPPTPSRTTSWASTSAPSRSRRSPTRLTGARTVFWNGPMGVFELAPFAEGTRRVAEAIAARHDALSVVGGGDTAAAVRAARHRRVRLRPHLAPAAARRSSTSRASTLPGLDRPGGTDRGKLGQHLASGSAGCR